MAYGLPERTLALNDGTSDLNAGVKRYLASAVSLRPTLQGPV